MNSYFTEYVNTKSENFPARKNILQKVSIIDISYDNGLKNKYDEYSNLLAKNIDILSNIKVQFINEKDIESKVILGQKLIRYEEYNRDVKIELDIFRESLPIIFKHINELNAEKKYNETAWFVALSMKIFPKNKMLETFLGDSICRLDSSLANITKEYFDKCSDKCFFTTLFYLVPLKNLCKNFLKKVE